jgi:excisionase family DNA binding protein
MTSTKYPLISIADAARMCGVYNRTVVAWFDQGRLKGYKLPGGHRRICRKSLAEFMAKNGIET